MTSCAMPHHARRRWSGWECLFLGALGHRQSTARRGVRWSGGEGGIRTHDTVARMPHFECGAFDHSATSPWTAGCVALSARPVERAAYIGQGAAVVKPPMHLCPDFFYKVY